MIPPWPHSSQALPGVQSGFSALAGSPPLALSELPPERDLSLLRSVGPEPKTRVLDTLLRENMSLGRQCPLSSMTRSGRALQCLFHGHVTWSINTFYTSFRPEPHARAGSLMAMLLLSVYTVYFSEIREKCWNCGCQGGGEAIVVTEAQKTVQ